MRSSWPCGSSGGPKPEAPNQQAHRLAKLVARATEGAARSPKLLAVQERDGWDVAVVGAGPAGLAAASAAAAAGARTIVLERAEHPRYKTCGGGLIGASRAAAGGLIDVPARD